MSTIKTLLQDAENAGYLSSNETLNLIKNIALSNANKAEAKERLIKANLKWILSKVKCYQKLAELDDLLMAGVSGFTEALNNITIDKIESIAKTYDNNYVASLMAYATSFIRKEATTEIANISNYELTEYRQKQISKVRKELKSVEELFGNDISYEDKLEEVAWRTGLSIKRIKTALDYSERNISLYTPINTKEDNEENDILTFENTLQTRFEDEIFNNYMIRDIQIALDYLSDIQHQVVSEFVGLDHNPKLTVTQIATVHGKTRQWVYNTLNASYEILKSCPLDLDAYYYRIG